MLSLENKLIRPGSGGPGPRIGASYDGEYYRYLLNKGMAPPAGSVDDDINTGVFIIKPDREEFLNLINMKISKGIKVRRSTPGEQGWLNEVYLYEKFDIGLEYNVRSGVAQVAFNFYTASLKKHFL